MVQSVVAAQEIYARAAIVNRERLEEFQSEAALVEAEELFRSAFWTDVRPFVREWRESRGLTGDPLRQLVESGYVQQREQQRSAKNRESATSYA
jgi:L-rhamnose isomerase / sugar isomerase